MRCTPSRATSGWLPQVTQLRSSVAATAAEAIGPDGRDADEVLQVLHVQPPPPCELQYPAHCGLAGPSFLPAESMQFVVSPLLLAHAQQLSSSRVTMASPHSWCWLSVDAVSTVRHTCHVVGLSMIMGGGRLQCR
jgi:hypothetical protein